MSIREVASAGNVGLFSVDGLKTMAASLRAENALALDSLAFACTYGKKNCLTNDMYSGELSYGKVCRLVWGKLSEGVVRC